MVEITMSELKEKYNEQLHEEMCEVGRKLEKKTTHQLPKPFLNAILGTMEYYGADSKQLAQAKFDLFAAKYKIWDALGMWYTGRLEAKGELLKCLENFCKLYIAQNHVGGFAWFLRGHDLDIESPKRCEDCIQSYKDWLTEIVEKGENPNDFD